MDTQVHEAKATTKICDSAFEGLDEYILVDAKLEWHRFTSFVSEQNFLGSAGLSCT